MMSAWVKAGLILLCIPVLAHAQFKDTKHGFSFKPPKDYVAVALSPGDFLTLARYHDPQTDYGGDQGRQGFNRQFEVSFWPTGRKPAAKDDEAAAEGDEPDADSDSDADEDGDETADPFEDFASLILERRFGSCEVVKEKSVTIAGGKGLEVVLSSTRNPLMYYLVMLDQPDGRWILEGSAIADRFDKASTEFSKAARSFARIPKKDQASHEAMLGQLSEQERFLQRQVDRLPPGWSHLRTPRYLFLYDADKGFVKQMSEQIEGLRDEYERLYPPDKPIEAVSIVRVCKNFEEYVSYGGSAGSGGYWNSAERELVFFDQAPRSETLCVLNHEAFHQFIYYFYGELAPHSWYNEGHGDYFSGARLTKSYRITSYGNAPGSFERSGFMKDMARLKRQGKSISEGAAAPLKELTHYSHAEYYDRGNVRPVAWYPQGWAFVHMLREAKGLDPKWQRILPDYLKCLVEAREEVAAAIMKKALAQAESKKKGSSAELSTDIRDYYRRLDVVKVQNLAWDKTFKDWTDADWARIDAFFLDYCESL